MYKLPHRVKLTEADFAHDKSAGLQIDRRPSKQTRVKGQAILSPKKGDRRFIVAHLPLHGVWIRRRDIGRIRGYDVHGALKPRSLQSLEQITFQELNSIRCAVSFRIQACNSERRGRDISR